MKFTPKLITEHTFTTQWKVKNIFIDEFGALTQVMSVLCADKSGRHVKVQFDGTEGYSAMKLCCSSQRQRPYF